MKQAQTNAQNTAVKEHDARSDALDVGRRDVASLISVALGALALAGCTEPAIAAPLPTGIAKSDLTGSSFLWADTIADLRTIIGSDISSTSKPVAVLGGYWTVGDGGGGVFYWDPISSTGDNRGTIIVPTGSSTGRWVRLYSGAISVKWFGAKGDGAANDTASIQAAIDFVGTLPPAGSTGNTLFFPPGNYKIVVPSNGVAALKLTANNVCLLGAGGPPSGASLVVTGNGGGDCAILIERYINTSRADYSQIRNLSIVGQGILPRDLVVVHASNVSISDCYVAQCARYGILIESNTKGGALFGSTVASSSQPIMAEMWRLNNIQLVSCSTSIVGGGAVEKGAAVYVHGSDTNGGLACGLVANDCNLGFADFSLSGGTWIACYSQNSGYASAHNKSTFIGCLTEDTPPAQFDPGHVGAVVGGDVLPRNAAVFARSCKGVEGVDETGNSLGFATLVSQLDCQDGISFQSWNAFGRSSAGWSWGDRLGALLPKWYTLGRTGNSVEQGLAIASDDPSLVAQGIQPGDLWICGAQWWLGQGNSLVSGTRMKVVYGTSQPTGGTFKQGDICMNTAPTASGDGAVHLWRCVAGGRPGVWAKVALT
jgi:hypothetical protein